MKTDELNGDKINILLDTHEPLIRINTYKLKFKSKPWIILGLQKSISVKNKLLKNLINEKEPILKEVFHTNYKNIETYSPSLWRKVNSLILTNILKEIGILLRTYRKESKPLFL